MKNKICILILLFSITISAITFNISTYNADGLDVNKQSEQNYNKLSFQKDVYNICNFEEEKETKKIIYENWFGKWSFNKDSKFIKNGKGSLKVEAQGFGLGTDVYYGAPTMRIDLQKFSDSLCDFTKVEYIAFDVFNGGNKTEELKFGFICKIKNGDFNQQSEIKNYKLNPNSWTRCFYPISYEELSLTFDLYNVKQLIFKFTPKYYKDKLTPLYIDNITMKKTEAIRETLPIILDENEFCDFEKEYQKYILFGSEFLTPKLEIVSDQKYVTSGKNVLKVTMPHGTIKDNSWPNFKFSDTLIKTANLGKYDPKTSSLKFDCYNTQDTAMKFFIKFITENKSRPDGNITTILFVASPGKSTCSINFDKINELGWYKGEKVTMLEELSSIRVDWGEFPTADKVFYFDNFRVEKNY